VIEIERTGAIFEGLTDLLLFFLAAFTQHRRSMSQTFDPKIEIRKCLLVHPLRESEERPARYYSPDDWEITEVLA